MDKASNEYKDRRNAEYRNKHKDDVISEHGRLMRKYFAKTSREKRAENRAKRQAIKDILDYLIETKQVDSQHINQVMWIFE